jgi:hypothetical protein
MKRIVVLTVCLIVVGLLFEKIEFAFTHEVS